MKNKSGIQLGVGSKRDLEIGYDPLEGVLYIDRIRTPDKTKSDKFYTFNYFTTPVKLKGNKLKLHIFFDHSVVEVFANDGEVVMSAQFFPDAKDNFISLFGSSEKTVFNQVSCWPLKSIWKP
ncbi:MAG: GH32 C-terminal domain-containing protein [Chitinophagaceae bacterium]|nr:GH32 C-terminal domain-containing protein [Chitinophagaceae bacterium]